MPPAGDFNFGEFSNTYASPTLGSFPESLGNLQPIQPNPHAIYPAIPQQQQQVSYGAAAPRPGEKRKSSESAAPARSMSMEEATRLAAEEDKRRRNTAASARFRVKKKQREQALEKSAKEMGEKVNVLENRISQLETENKWLKNLIMEKNEGKDDIAAMWQEFSSKKRSSDTAEAKVKTERENAERAADDESRTDRESSKDA